MEDDEDVVARAVGGDEQAFSILFDRYRERVFRLAVSILGPAFVGEAEEVTQEVFLRVHRALGSFRGESKFGTWLYRVTFTQTVNLKSRVRYRVPHLTDELLALEKAKAPDALTRLESLRRDAVVAEAIGELPETYQSALRLHYWMGESVAEISTLLGVPPNTVKSYLFRARKLLKVLLRERGHEGV